MSLSLSVIRSDFISDGLQGEQEVTTYRTGKDFSRLKGQQLQRLRQSEPAPGKQWLWPPDPPVHTYHRFCLSPEPSLVGVLIFFFSKVITSLMEHTQRTYLPTLTVSEGSTHGHLIPSFWTHCEGECHGRQVGVCGGGDSSQQGSSKEKVHRREGQDKLQPVGRHCQPDSFPPPKPHLFIILGAWDLAVTGNILTDVLWR